jgi:ubiquinone/menaquinone biosynthesis C-methylase UbiE
VSRALCLAWRVLDIGCGTGQTTRQAAHAAAPAEVLGVDVSAAALNLGRRRAREQGLSNISFEHGDAQVHPFPAGHFDVAVSRFGTMFFHDPLAAFTNAARALRPGARLVLLVWQSHDGDEWSTAVRDALAPNTPRPTPPPGFDAFSLAEPSVVEELLGGAGFGAVTFTNVREPVYYGPDVATPPIS